MTTTHHDAVTHDECADVQTGTIHHDAVTHDVIVEVTPAHWQRYSWKGGPIPEGETPVFGDGSHWQANVAGDPHDVGVEGAYDRSQGGHGNADWFWLARVDAVTRTDTIVDTEAYDEPVFEHQCVTVTDTEAWDETVIDEPSNPIGPVVIDGPESVIDPLPEFEGNVVKHEPWHMPACTTEDGSAAGQEFPCLWDASAQGNGDGCSFVLDEAGGVPHYVTSIGADGTVYTDDGACGTVTPIAQPVVAPVVQAEVSTAVPSSNPIGLAETGSDPTAGLVLAGALVVTGIVSLITRRVLR